MTEDSQRQVTATVAARLRYEQMMRALDRQADVLGHLRGRASIVLSATGITASLFGARALGSDAPGWLKGVALSIVALGLLSCIAVLASVHDIGQMPSDPRRPRPLLGKGRARQWKVTLSADELQSLTASDSEPAMLDAIVAALKPARILNHGTVARRSFALNAAAVLLLLQIVAWSVVLLEA